MKISYCWKPLPGAFLLMVALPTVGFSLLALSANRAVAQDNTDHKPTAPPVVAPGTPRITEIVVNGNKVLSTTAIIIASGHNVGDPCNEKTLLEIKQNLTETGNFGSQRNPENPEEWVKVHSEENDGKCKVVIDVDENDAIKNITITGSGPIKAEDVQQKLNVKAGTIYNPLRLRRDTDAILKLYNDKGYIAAIGNDLGIDDKGVLTIPIVVVRVAEIKLEKLHKTKRYVILREVQTKVGDYFNRNRWRDDIQRIYNLDLFEEVIPRDDLIGAGQIRLTLSLPEKRTGSVSVGAGYSNRQQLIGRGEITETNFRGSGETVNLLLEAGGAANKSSVELGFNEPWLDKHHTDLNVQVYDKVIYRFANSLTNANVVATDVGTSDVYNEQRIGSTITLSRPLPRRYRIALTARGESVTTDPIALGGVNASILQNGPIYSLGISGVHDTRDQPLDPVMGGYQTVSFQIGHANLSPPVGSTSQLIPGVFGSHNFGKVSAEERQFFSLQGPRKKLTDEKSLIAFRTLLGGTVGTMPFFEQFFVGGADTLRGYREDRFWGKYMLLSSVELRQPLARGLKGVLFLDVGDAWGGPYSNVSIEGFDQSGFHPHAGVGLGIRVRTPLGPIRLDYGIGDEGGQTHFSIGNVF